jgi:hypothetical protein
MIDENRKEEICGFSKAKEFINSFCHPFLQGYYPVISGIVTTNYDLLIEYSLGTKGFNYGVSNKMLYGRGAYPISQWINPIVLTGKIPLAKVHGSISWDEENNYTDGRRGITGNALIVAPTPEKKPPKILSETWMLGKKILFDANSLVVFGFAFNPYDEAILNMLSNSGSNIKNILIIDIKPNIQQASRIWPRANVKGCLPPPKGKTEINNWKKENLCLFEY